jgi:hypothetical protein
MIKSHDVIYLRERNFDGNPDLMFVWSCDLYKQWQIDQTLPKCMLYADYGLFFKTNSTTMVTEGGDVTCDQSNTNKQSKIVIKQVIYRLKAFFKVNSTTMVTSHGDVTCDRPNKVT